MSINNIGILKMLSIFLYLGGNSIAKEWIEKGNALNEQGRYLEAIECFDKALEIDPKNAYAWFGKGATLHKLGKILRSSEMFQHGRNVKESLNPNISLK